MSNRKWSRKNTQNNGRYQEWVGDSIVLVMARKFLLENFPHNTVGQLHYCTRLITSDPFLNTVGGELNLNIHGRTRWNAYACALEEHFFKLFVDEGFNACYNLMLPFFTRKIGDIKEKLKAANE